MTDADDLVGQSESACDLGGARKQGTDPHVLMISLSIAHLPPEPGTSQPLGRAKAQFTFTALINFQLSVVDSRGLSDGDRSGNPKGVVAVGNNQ